jgi:uncharacterized protein (DUF2384 family)
MEARGVIPDLGLDLRKTPDLSDAKTRARLSPAAIAAFLKIVDLWDLRNDDAMALLGGVSNGKYHELKRKQRASVLSQDELTRVSYLIGIFKSLNILFSTKLANRWMQLPNTNPMFKGAAPVHLMVRLGMPAMMETRRLLDTRRGGR